MSKVRSWQKNLSKEKLLLIRLVISSIFLFMVVFFEYKWITLSVAKTTQQSMLEIKKSELSTAVGNYIRVLNFEKEHYIEEHPQVTEEEVKTYLYQSLRNWIYTEEFPDGSYPWVSEILSFDGGENYARRLIHPNLRGTEGNYISTSMDDGTGYYLYEEELEGIKKDGYIFHEYNFKKLDSDEVTRKLGYTKLYDDYHWVISMGVHLDQLDVYIEDAQRKVRPYILAGTAILECILFVSYFILYHIHKCQYIKEKRKLKEEVNFDLLTGAASRRFGQSLLQHRLAKYKSQHYNSLVMMGDIDYFKHVNDFYGHDIGDIALQKFAEAIKSVVQDRDHIIRWGGDEFICVFDYEKEGEEMLIAERLLEAIHQIEIETDKEKVHLTASIGFSLYHESDEFYTDVINRADIALYRAKNSGRDRYEIER